MGYQSIFTNHSPFQISSWALNSCTESVVLYQLECRPRSFRGNYQLHYQKFYSFSVSQGACLLMTISSNIFFLHLVICKQPKLSFCKVNIQSLPTSWHQIKLIDEVMCNRCQWPAHTETLYISVNDKIKSTVVVGSFSIMWFIEI